MLKVESKVGIIHRSAEDIFNVFSNFNNFISYLPQEHFQDVQITDDSCSFTSNGQFIKVLILEKQPFKTIKYGSDENTAVPFFFWVQLIQIEPYVSKAKLTIHIDIPLMAQPFIKGKIQKALNTLIDKFSSL